MKGTPDASGWRRQLYKKGVLLRLSVWLSDVMRSVRIRGHPHENGHRGRDRFERVPELRAVRGGSRRGRIGSAPKVDAARDCGTPRSAPAANDAEGHVRPVGRGGPR